MSARMECKCTVALPEGWARYRVMAADGRAWGVLACCKMAAGEMAVEHALAVEGTAATIREVVHVEPGVRPGASGAL